MERNQSLITIPTFLKWAGGKRRILPLIEKFFPAKIERYFEPFLGGGSVFFYIKQKYNPNLCVISDTNLDLITVYLHVKNQPEKLIKHLSELKQKHSEAFYYEVRSDFNSNKIKGIKRSAAFIYLNKTCFNGLYRVNKANKFNVPFGKIEDPSIYDEHLIYAASKLLNDRVEIKHRDYQEVIRETKGGDFVYLDPCYDPLKKTSFVNYTPDRFSEQDRMSLHSFIEGLRKKGVKVVLSNNDVPEIRRLYPTKVYKVEEIVAPRFIGSRSSYRTDVTELVISTYH